MNGGNLRATAERLAWQSGRVLRTLGWPGIAGATMLLAAAGLLWFAVLPWQAETEALRADTETLRQRQVLRSDAAFSASPRRQLDEFYGMFPGSDSIAATLDAIFAAAGRHNLNLDQADYKLVSINNRLQRYEITLPVRGRYVQLRSFLADLMKENATLAIAGVAFTRNTSTDIGVEAQVQLVLYLQDKP